MTLRRNVITLLIWISVVTIFTIHVILTRRKDEAKHGNVIERSIDDLVKRTEDLDKKLFFKSADTTPKQEQCVTHHEYKQTVNEIKDGATKLKSEKLKLINRIGELQDEISSLQADKTKMLEKEKKYKKLAKRLAAKLKGHDQNLPKLDPNIPWVFAITPTYSRYTQKADLVRLSQTLLLVTNFHWIIVEDSKHRTELVNQLLQESGLSFTHLNIRTPSNMQRKKGERYNKHHRGVSQRNLGLQWLRDNVNIERTPGVLYFMDDDNTYHRKIFDEMRYTNHVSIWPVGLSGGARWAGPIVEHGKVVKFHTNWAPNRTFPIDMAGFAIGLKYLLKERPLVKFNSLAKRGFLEPTFLESLTTMNELEPLADNCSKVLVWHTRTESAKKSILGEREMIKQGKETYLNMEV